jgi:hypothetical protein
MNVTGGRIWEHEEVRSPTTWQRMSEQSVANNTIFRENVFIQCQLENPTRGKKESYSSRRGALDRVSRWASTFTFNKLECLKQAARRLNTECMEPRFNFVEFVILFQILFQSYPTISHVLIKVYAEKAAWLKCVFFLGHVEGREINHRSLCKVRLELWRLHLFFGHGLNYLTAEIPQWTQN